MGKSNERIELQRWAEEDAMHAKWKLEGLE
jgi:hypothetical protein